jgi:hypothetical protein
MQRWTPQTGMTRLAGTNSLLRPVPQQTIYLIHTCGREFAIAEHDLTGPLRELVMAVLAEGEAP